MARYEAITTEAGATASFSLPLETAIAPSFPGVFRSEVQEDDTGPPELARSELQSGDGEFEIVEELGRGASGVVYLARQISLNRRVALKVTYNVGAEARTMASLEHRNIVQVFSETVSDDGNLRLICMQFVAGMTLADLLQRLRDDAAELDGSTVLRHLAGRQPEARSDAASHPKPDGLLEQHGYVAIVCAVAERLALGLHHAHQQGVVHRDVKPANILLHPSGQPLLADFSLSFQSLSRESPEDEVFGGTLAYMAPEHLDALVPSSGVGREAVNERSDVYSLGLVLFEMLSLQPPLIPIVGRAARDDCRALAAARRAEIPVLADRPDGVDQALNWTLAGCLAARPEQRFSDAGQVAEALQGCRQLVAINEQLPTSRWLEWLSLRMMLGCSVVGSFANVLGAILGIVYTFSTPRVLADLSQQGRRALYTWFVFHVIAGGFLMMAALVVVVRPYAKKIRNRALPASELADTRRRCVNVTTTMLLLNFLAWLPGFFVTPLILFQHKPDLDWTALVDFLGTYSVLTMIVLTLSYFLGELCSIRITYPRLWADCRRIHEVAAAELKAVPRRLRLFHMLAGLVPLAAAIGLIMIGSANFAPGGYFTFRMLAVGLIAGGLLAFITMGQIRAIIERTVQLFAGERR